MTLVIFSLIVSLDGFMAGSALGMRKVKVPLMSLCLISLTSAFVMYTSMSLGGIFRDVSATRWVERVGALILVVLGLVFLLKPKKVQMEPGSTKNALVAVWHDPLLADQDRSGDISFDEALVLGVVLALDSLGAGLGAGMAGLDPIASSLYIGVGKFSLISLGIICGAELTHIFSEKVLSMLPGVMLVLLGCWRMVT